MPESLVFSPELNAQRQAAYTAIQAWRDQALAGNDNQDLILAAGRELVGNANDPLGQYLINATITATREEIRSVKGIVGYDPDIEGSLSAVSIQFDDISKSLATMPDEVLEMVIPTVSRHLVASILNYDISQAALVTERLNGLIKRMPREKQERFIDSFVGCFVDEAIMLQQRAMQQDTDLSNRISLTAHALVSISAFNSNISPVSTHQLELLRAIDAESQSDDIFELQVVNVIRHLNLSMIPEDVDLSRFAQIVGFRFVPLEEGEKVEGSRLHQMFQRVAEQVNQENPINREDPMGMLRRSNTLRRGYRFLSEAVAGKLTESQRQELLPLIYRELLEFEEFDLVKIMSLMPSQENLSRYSLLDGVIGDLGMPYVDSVWPQLVSIAEVLDPKLAIKLTGVEEYLRGKEVTLVFG